MKPAELERLRGLALIVKDRDISRLAAAERRVDEARGRLDALDASIRDAREVSLADVDIATRVAAERFCEARLVLRPALLASLAALQGDRDEALAAARRAFGRWSTLVRLTGQT
ncbi:MAG: hypothetical protein H6895_02575 [Defluviimonas sp.]|uniref:hypothetical protein n=1 Tax=Albidovulum sp. TaxID=1872424 RepID=UPI002A323338|nr:hypothetical protein [Defluviimonas sp.]